MDETSKIRSIRGKEFRDIYFSGRVVDIGCGRDIVVPHAIPFDLEQGDAQRILDYLEPESFDCVHSSHCLEHMRDVESALKQWWALIRPGGYLVIVVPDEDLYEQGAWPSLFNPDHKATFNLGKSESWSPVSYDLQALAQALPGAQVIEACVQDNAYDHRLARKKITRFERLLFKCAKKFRERAFKRLVRVGLPAYPVGLVLDRLERALGAPVDQTIGPALAQIQLVAQKLA
jgi:SAM-dependent methyltransferase